MGENASAAGPSTTATTTGTDAAASPAAGAANTTEAAPTGASPTPGATPATGANLISLAQTAVSQIAPVIQAVTGNTGTQNSATAS